MAVVHTGKGIDTTPSYLIQASNRHLEADSVESDRVKGKA